MRKSAVSLLLFVVSVTVGLAQEPTPEPTPKPKPTPWPKASIDPIILRPNFWETTVPEIAQNLNELQFAWTSSAQDTARSARPKMYLGARPIEEALLRFKDGKLSGATLFYYNRGDGGEMSDYIFEELLTKITADLTTLVGKQPTERGRDATGAVKAEGRIWETSNTQYLLEWSVTKASRAKGTAFRAEFIRLTIQPAGAPPLAIGERAADNSTRAAVKRFVARDHIEKTATGAKLKDVPMVDQGEKGYCVVASVERVMRYYGGDVDQHELAQIADTSAEEGTSPEGMLNSMKKLTGRLGVKMKAMIEWSTKDFFELLDDYNRAAKKGKRAPEVTGSYQTLDDYYKRMKPDIYKEVRLKKTADYGKFQREIVRTIDEGIPLLWSVRIGIVKEKEIPQGMGGHMRLIIGYDNTTKEIIYTDSWGMGHEEKRMSWEDAWTITTGLYSLQPISA